jgi:hypothetical protein
MTNGNNVDNIDNIMGTNIPGCRAQGSTTIGFVSTFIDKMLRDPGRDISLPAATSAEHIPPSRNWRSGSRPGRLDSKHKSVQMLKHRHASIKWGGGWGGGGGPNRGWPRCGEATVNMQPQKGGQIPRPETSRARENIPRRAPGAVRRSTRWPGKGRGQRGQTTYR